MFGKASGSINNEVGLQSFHCSDDMLCILVEKEQSGMLADQIIHASRVRAGGQFYNMKCSHDKTHFPRTEKDEKKRFKDL